MPGPILPLWVAWLRRVAWGAGVNEKMPLDDAADLARALVENGETENLKDYCEACGRFADLEPLLLRP